MEDFCQFVLAFVSRSPSTVRATPQLANIFELALASTLLPAGQTVMTALELIEDLLRSVLTGGDQSAVQAVVQQFGQKILVMILQGIAQDYPEDSQEPVTGIVKALCGLAPPETVRQWIAVAIEGLPGHVIPAGSKQETLQTFDRYVATPSEGRCTNPFRSVFAEGNPELVKTALRLYVRTARRARDRRDRMSNTLSERR
jgi:hypothetical protein